MAANPERDPLEEYRAKRAPERTPEPFGRTPVGGGASSGALLFVVQQHAARRLHYDFRLELGAVLKSWAVPKGPSLDPAEKRFAVAVEDHPLEYANFEGVIPEGNYGAGGVIVWDRGTWLPVEDPESGLAKGKLIFELKGYKLRGVWTLVRTKRSSKEWLLIKKADAWASSAQVPADGSVLSGLTLEELRAGSTRRKELVARLERLGTPKRPLRAGDAGLMLAQTRQRPFSSKEWLFELKYDGYRLLLAREGGEARLLYRRGNEVSATFPEIARAVRSLPFEEWVMDGEVVVLDDNGRPSFQRLQKRAQLTRSLDVERRALEHSATAYVFDLLSVEGHDLRRLPLVERKRLLREILPRAGPLRFTDHVEEHGEDLYAEIGRLGLEGMVAKRASSPYREGRSADWLKFRRETNGDFAVVGFTEPKGARSGIGALHLGVRSNGGFRYAGRVGTGFDDRLLEDLRRRLERSRISAAPCSGPVPRGNDDRWVSPKLVCEVRFKEWTEDGALRQPVFVRMRDDKSVEECSAEGNPGILPEPAAGAPVPERIIRFTNLDKVFWPEERYTKGDLIEFYRQVSPWLLPYLRDRPLVLTRFPDGIAGKSFYQKDAPRFVPEWIRTERMWSEHAGREIDYFVCDDIDSILYLVNLGTIPLHLWSSRVGSLERPDWCVLDLDPKGAPFADVVTLALALHRLCDAIELPAFIKTSGATGLHVLIPLGAQWTYEESRSLGELLARVVNQEHPDISTIVRKVSDRAGRVYLDYLQNRHGQTIAGPFSVRPLPGAPVSTPLRWNEVGARLDPRRFTLTTLPARLARRPEDPLREVLTAKPDLAHALERLAEKLAR